MDYVIHMDIVHLIQLQSLHTVIAMPGIRALRARNLRQLKHLMTVTLSRLVS
jgi:hypothetical protein